MYILYIYIYVCFDFEVFIDPANIYVCFDFEVFIDPANMAGAFSPFLFLGSFRSSAASSGAIAQGMASNGCERGSTRCVRIKLAVWTSHRFRCRRRQSLL